MKFDPYDSFPEWPANVVDRWLPKRRPWFDDEQCQSDWDHVLHYTQSRVVAAGLPLPVAVSEAAAVVVEDEEGSSGLYPESHKVEGERLAGFEAAAVHAEQERIDRERAGKRVHEVHEVGTAPKEDNLDEAVDDPLELDN